MMKQFKVIVPSFNSIDYLPRTLSSIENQTDPHVQVCVIDDASTILAQKKIIQEYCIRNNWRMDFHEKNEGALSGLVKAIGKLGCDDDDVIVVVDGDDWLSHPNVLAFLRTVYDEMDVYLTWGQCEVYPQSKTPIKYAQPIPERVITQKLYRDIPFVFWHLGTFKYYLWRHIKDQDLRDEDGKYFLLMKDKATLYPMLEMAGSKIHFIKNILYIYNIENPLNDFTNTLPEEHRRVDALIRSRAKYQTLDFPKP